MRKSTKAVSVVMVVATMGNVMSVVQANPTPPLRVPTAVVQAGARVPVNSSPFWGPDQWGSDTYTSLKVIDNQSPPGHYGLGKVHESFDNLSIGFNCPMDLSQQLYNGVGVLNDYGINSTWDPTVPGYFSDGVFTDHNRATSVGPLTSPTANTGNDQWFTVTQHWDIRDCPGSTKYALPAGVIPPGQLQRNLNTHFLDYRQTYYTRSPGF